MALALEDNGRAEVLQKVGVEPTGDAFNSISLEPGTGRPRNPMINAGAIATAGLIAGKSPADAAQVACWTCSALYAGRELSIDEAVYRSESETGHRNRAIGHMLRNFDILTTDPMPVGRTVFQAMLRFRDLPRPRRHGGHAGQSRRQSRHRQTGHPRRIRRKRAERHGLLRHV